MSERPSGIPPGDPVTPKLAAVGIIIRRGDDGGWQVVLGLRTRRSRFLPGAWAFIGGAVDESDEPARRGTLKRCVSREVQEEIGLTIDAESWRDAGRRVTPPIYPVRYDTRFFLVEVPNDIELSAEPPAPEELEELRFVGAGRALVEWETGESEIPPVLPPILRLLADTRRRSVQRLASKLAEIHELEEKVPRIEFVPGLWMVPVASDTLPPATHTNVWLVGGKRFLVIDPGSSHPEEIDKVLAVVARREEEGHRPQAVFLTHHHADHASGAAEVAKRLGVPLLAHAETLSRIGSPPKGVKTEPIEDGHVFDLAGISAQALWTPGHAAGHMILYVPEKEVAVVGDMLSGQSTILIDPEDGDMGQYMRSLRRLQDLRCRLLLPGHGIALRARDIDHAIEHRWGREAGLLAAIDASPRAIEEIVEQAYVDVPNVPTLLKRRQALAHLIDLERKGVVRREGESWATAAHD